MTDKSAPGRWTAERANAWYAKQPWLVGSNFVPSDASNEFEMWQAETFNPASIDRELGWAKSIGMNSMRVFLHDLLWDQDRKGFTSRIDRYLDISSKHGISTMLVLFDSVWDPHPKLGPQPEPRPGIHNSRWAQSPGEAALADPSQEGRLRDYVEGVVGAFANDERVIVWDVWNEPSNMNTGKYPERADKVDLVGRLLPKAFAWTRNANPIQPVTAGVWIGASLYDDPLAAMQIENSDIITFHDYQSPEKFEAKLAGLPHDRPLLLTEFMARKSGSTFQTILPIVKREKIAAYGWGLVAGRSNTVYPWDSWVDPYLNGPPDPWFHDVFHADGRPYREDEVAAIRALTGVS